ncbi:MFS general substrate transporter [Mycena floridula]|nr:MFS general substrate transporter [Mycena floridula]
MPTDTPDPQGDSELLPTFEKLPEDHCILDSEWQELGLDGRIIDAGLRAWPVVRGATCNNTATWGLLNSWGILQAYYGTKALVSISPSRIVDRVYSGKSEMDRRLSSPGLFRLTPQNTAACRQHSLRSQHIPHHRVYAILAFLICQGIIVGFSCSTIYGPSMACISQWWNQRLGLIMGILSVGTSAGGTMFPIVARLLIPAVGFKWTMRIIGFILLLILGIGNITLSRRLPPVSVSGGLWNLTAFKSKAYSLYCASCLVAFLGIYTVLTHIDVIASRWVGSDFQSFYLVARLVFGKLSDRTGTLNVIIPMTACTGILTYAWPFAHSITSIIVVGILVWSVPLLAWRRLGMALSIMALGAVAGLPVSGAINTATGGYKVVGYYAGTVILLAVAMMSGVRYLILGRMRGKI